MLVNVKGLISGVCANLQLMLKGRCVSSRKIPSGCPLFPFSPCPQLCKEEICTYLGLSLPTFYDLSQFSSFKS